MPLVRFRGQWVEINADGHPGAQPISGRNREQVSLREVVQIGLGADQRAQDDNVSLAAGDWLRDLLERLQQKGRIEQMDTPEDFCGQLRPYQQLGYSWLAFLRDWGLGACLAGRHGPGARPSRPWPPWSRTASRATTGPTCSSARHP